jgi:hypothetical protein
MTKVKSLDLDQHLGTVTLSNGERLTVPKLSISKIIKIVKFLGVDGTKLYSEFRETLLKEDMDDIEKLGVLLEQLDEKQLVHIFSIILETEDEDVLKLDLNELLDVLVLLSDKLDLKKTYSSIRGLMKKLFDKELPESLGDWIKERQRATQERAAQQARIAAAAEKIAQTETRLEKVAE